MTEDTTRTRRRGRARAEAAAPSRDVDYRHLKNPFPPVGVFSEDRVAALHEAALGVLEDLGVLVLLPEARALFRAAGARVDESTRMVHLGREIVEAALATAPRDVTIRAGRPEHDVRLKLGHLTIQPGGGAPHASDRRRGRRPGSLRDFEELTRLVHSFDVLHMIGPAVEPQDIDPGLRHYATMRTALTLSDKATFVYARGRAQVADGFEMLRLGRGVDEATFAADPHCYTVINTNSPRQLDIPMAQGLIDFARAGQVSIVTPFCLMGAMAPVSVAGALVLSHAEALAAITLAQLARPGAPVCYGAFVSNVDMRSGAPAFGTPEQVKASLGAGQLARLLGLPWRSACGCAANANDAQAAHETQMSAWGALLAGATIVLHGAGWMEGGLTMCYEKLITDLEALQVFAELCTPVPDGDLALDALAEVQPGGHFFAAAHTMARYQTAFYQPLVADWSNFGRWSEQGAEDADTRATAIWEARLAEPRAMMLDPERLDALDAFIARRKGEGGAPPLS